ncbi:hypothetical protein GCM10009795_061130 [Nocardioides hankookensis]|uniref:Uncharacterized protein n=1 Tax=Nocardioides hankookensis TaxID=443157 RepID=A0ABW1LNV4_9ACTN
MSSDVDPWWFTLVDALGEIGSVDVRQPSGLIVRGERADGTPLVVDIVMTPDEWDDLVSISWGVVATAAHHVRGLVLGQPPDLRYLVYDCYQLVPCDAPELPVPEGRARLEELSSQHPDGIIPGGGWYAHPPGEA